jgi:hypothetical protein
MNTITDTSPLYITRNHSRTPVSRIIGDMATPTVTAMSSFIKRPHDNSVSSVEQNFPHRISNPQEQFENFSKSLLKNKALLVPTRLALKRQRASLIAPTKKVEPIYSDALQMELGNPEEFTLHSDQGDDELDTMISQNIHLSSEQNRMQSRSNHTSPLRGGTSHTVPTDISLMYRYVKNNILDIFIFFYLIQHKC